MIPSRNRRTKAEVEGLLLAGFGRRTPDLGARRQGADIADYLHRRPRPFCAKLGQVLIQLPRKKSTSDPWSLSAFETYEILKRAKDASGRPLDIVVIPEPSPKRFVPSSDDFVSRLRQLLRHATAP